MNRELTGLQTSLMEVLWERGEATVAEVRDALEPDRSLARTTVGTLLSRLEERGLLTHRVRGREYVYRPLVERGAVRRSMLQAFAERVFGGDLPAMVRHLLGSEDVDPEDLREVRRILARREEELAEAEAGESPDSGEEGES